jgi:acyl carrier protein
MTANTEIARRLRATLAKELKQDVTSITPEHTLRGDLGLNSLDAIELMFRIEEEFDLSIPDDDIQGLVKVGDVIEYLERRLTPAAPAARATPAAATPAAATTRPTPAAKAPANKAKAKASRRHA